MSGRASAVGLAGVDALDAVPEGSRVVELILVKPSSAENWKPRSRACRPASAGAARSRRPAPTSGCESATARRRRGRRAVMLPARVALNPAALDAVFGIERGQRLSSCEIVLAGVRRGPASASATTPTAKRRRGARRARERPLPCTVRSGVEGCQGQLLACAHVMHPARPARHSAPRPPGRRCAQHRGAARPPSRFGPGGDALSRGTPLDAGGIAVAIGLGLGADRAVHAGARALRRPPLPAPRAALARARVGGSASALALVAVGFAMFFARARAPARGRRDHRRRRRAGGRRWRRCSPSCCGVFSVFTTVSTMGVVLGVASLVVVLA